MRSGRSLPLAAALLALLACDRKLPPTSSAAAVPTATKSVVMDETGAITSVPTGVAELDSLDSMRKQMAAIDHEFPRPAVPAEKPQTFRVVKVEEENGLIHLEDGRSLTLEGVQCSPSGMASVKKTIMAPDTEIAFVRPQPAELRGTPANLWEVDEMKPASGSPVTGYSLIVETAITSGWCVAKKKGEAGFNPRYAALEAFARKNAK